MGHTGPTGMGCLNDKNAWITWRLGRLRSQKCQEALKPSRTIGVGADTVALGDLRSLESWSQGISISFKVHPSQLKMHLG